MTAQSDVGQLIRVLMKHPREAFVSQDSIDAQWEYLNFTAVPDFRLACKEFDALVRLLEDAGTQVELLPADDRTSLDSIYTRDASIISDRGAILCNMGKSLRSSEPGVQGDMLVPLGVDLLGTIISPGTVEGGDVAWLNERTVAVGHGYRTNADGIRQLRTLLGDTIDELVVVPLPHWNGAGDVMHLMSLISPIDAKLVLVYARLLPVPFRLWLLDRGFALIEVPDDEFASMGTNVLAIAPRRVLALRGNSGTRQALTAAGVDVIEYEGIEISVKGGGGPTCLTRPLTRSR